MKGKGITRQSKLREIEKVVFTCCCYEQNLLWKIVEQGIINIRNKTYSTYP